MEGFFGNMGYINHHADPVHFPNDFFAEFAEAVVFGGLITEPFPGIAGITDIIMPKKEGLETIVDLKADFPEVKIIAISGGGRLGPETYLELAGGFGANRLLNKPFGHEELLEAVQDLLGEVTPDNG